MDGSSAEKDHSRSVGKNWLMTGFCKTRTITESQDGAGAVVTGGLDEGGVSIPRAKLTAAIWRPGLLSTWPTSQLHRV